MCEKSGHVEKNEDILEKWCWQKTSHKRSSQRYTTMKMQRIKCWKLIQTYKEKWSFTKTEKMLAPYWNLYEKKQSTVQTPLDKFFFFFFTKKTL